MEYSVEVKDLALSFGSIAVLKHLSLGVKEGEFLVLLGPSGCGKSTLLNCIAGLLDISDGQVFISGKNVTWEEPKDRGIGMVFQSYALYPQMSVRSNLSFSLKTARLARKEIDRRVDRVAQLLQIDDLLDRKPAALSGGQRQRVAIGRALVRDVDVFLFDEPLSNLDAKLRAELRVELKRLHGQLENTMIYVTHDQIEAMTLADRIAIMKDGVIKQLDPPREIYNRPANLFVAGFIGSPAMNMLDGQLNAAPSPRFDGSAFSLDLAGYRFQTGQNSADLAGRDVVLGVRPEHIILNPDGANFPARASAVIEMTEPTGADTLAWCKLDETTVSLRCDADLELAPGQQVTLGFDASRCSIFDRLSGERL